MPAALYATGPWLGPGKPIYPCTSAQTNHSLVFGPLVGGFVAESYLRWRFIFWILFASSAFILILGILIMPETVCQFPSAISSSLRRISSMRQFY